MNGTRAARLLVIAAALSSPVAAFELDKGPYLQQVTRVSVRVAWETTAAAAGHVRYGVGAALDQRSTDTPSGLHHVVELTALTPGARYSYALYEGEVAQSPTYTFITDAGPQAAFRFIVMGDNRSDHAAHQRVVDTALGEPDVAFVLNTGDLVGSGEIESDWRTFFDVERELVARHAIYPTIGNHEEDGGDTPLYERIFELPQQPSGTERYYAFTYGNSRFLVLDGHVEVDPWYTCLLRGRWYDCFSEDQEAFIEDQLVAATADAEIEHVFVATHEGPYSSKEGRTGSAQLRDLLPLFLNHGVDIVLSGHDHYYEHGRAGNGIDYVITGGGGAPLYQIATDFMNSLHPHEPILSEAIHHYLLVEVDGPSIQVTTVTSAGDVLERFTVGERVTCGQPIDCASGTPGACAGSWDCVGGYCQWVCEPPPSCVSATDCPSPPGDACPGEWRCALGRCDWICEAECQADGDCAAHAPLNDCAAGRFQCMDEVCEWLCPAVDAGAVDSAALVDAAGRDAVVLDRGAGDTRSADRGLPDNPVSDAVSPDVLAAGADASGAAPGADDTGDTTASVGCGGCTQSPALSAFSAPTVLSLLALLACRRVRRRSPTRARL